MLYNSLHNRALRMVVAVMVLRLWLAGLLLH